jgi:hypothetical protein
MQKIAAIVKKHRGHACTLTPLSNASVEAWMKPGEVYFSALHGSCDCGTSLGLLGRGKNIDRAAQREGWNKAAKQLRAKGWSPTKVARWLASKEQYQAREVEQDALWKTGSGERAGQNNDWFMLMSEILDARLAQHVCLLLHWYHGPLKERIHIKNRTRINLRERGIGVLLEIEEDVIYEFY